MKNAIKILAILFSSIFILNLCSCKSNNQTDLSSAITTTKNSRTLLLTMTASDDLANIGGVRIVTSSCTVGAPIISDKADLTFLQNYTYSYYKTTKKTLEQQLLKNKTNYSFEVVTQNGSKYFLYLMSDGSIAMKQMCGDIDALDVSYDFYTADKKHMLTKEKLTALITKSN